MGYSNGFGAECSCNGVGAGAEMITASAERPAVRHSFEEGSLPIEALATALLTGCGEDPTREGLLRTPHRFAKAMREMTIGYTQSLDTIVNGAIFTDANSDMVVVRDIEFYSLCEHHLLPFYGRAHIAYVPDGRIVGLSKLPRIVNMFARRLQIQERLTQQITEAVEEVLAPKGVACLIQGNHMCMMMRGVQSQGASMITSSMRGVFSEDRAVREEFMKLSGSLR